MLTLDTTPEEQAFRREIRSWLLQNLPAGIREKTACFAKLDKQEILGWQRQLAERGWAAPEWPQAWGGTGWSVAQRFAFEDECAAAGAPTPVAFGLKMCGPVLLRFGNEMQQKRFLPRIYRGDDLWCQGYSEPGAGSDLASLRTRAVRSGGRYVVNGQKLWTSFAQAATMMFCLVRTEPSARKQDGISLLLIDMKTPGIRIRPIRTLDEHFHVNEVFMDNVEVPLSGLLGEEGKGWTYGKVLLERERGMTAILGLRLARQLEWIRAQAARTPVDGATLLDDPVFMHKLAQIQIEVIALDAMGQRTVADVMANVDSGYRGSMLKVRWSELLQRATELWVEAIGYEANGFAAVDGGGEPNYPMPGPVTAYLHGRVTTIYGGANEIQRNIIARRSLGL